MQKKTIRQITSIILLMAMAACFITGIIKWPFLIQTLGISFRQLPMAMITDIHDWSGLLLGLLALIHVIQYRYQVVRMIKLTEHRHNTR
jgi:hypothetical protein